MKSLIQQLTEKLNSIIAIKEAGSVCPDVLYSEYLKLDTELPRYLLEKRHESKAEGFDSSKTLHEFALFITALRVHQKQKEQP